MSPLDDARRLAEVDPWYEDAEAGTSFCIACGAYADVTGRNHHPDCPWLTLPRIVAALEAAERTVKAYDKPDDRATFWREFWALAGALRGDRA